MKMLFGIKRVLLVAVGFAVLGAGIGVLPAYAQAAKVGGAGLPLDVAVTYQAARETKATGGSFFMQGGAMELHAKVYRGLGVAASITGEHAGTGATGAAPFDMVVAAFGPRYTYKPRHRTSLFAETLVGVAYGFHSVFPRGSGTIGDPGNGTTDSANSLAVLVGGGLDIAVTPHIAVRAIQADWLRTQLPNGRDNVQNGLRIGAGLVFQWGRP